MKSNINWNEELIKYCSLKDHEKSINNCASIIDFLISRGADNLNGGLNAACKSGHKEIAEIMISRGANDWNAALKAACQDGHKEIVDLMISKGADNWNQGLKGACKGGHKEIADNMISKGATIGTMDYMLHAKKVIKK